MSGSPTPRGRRGSSSWPGQQRPTLLGKGFPRRALSAMDGDPTQGCWTNGMTDWAYHDPRFHKLLDYLSRVPAMQVNDTPSHGIGSGIADGSWWVKFSLTLDHPLAWNVVQEFGHVLNYLSITEPLPTTFKPVSPPPYMNGGPRDFLSWVIECREDAMSPDIVAEWLEGRLPRPVEDEDQWLDDE